MKRIVLFTALGTGLAIAGGVGLSTAQTKGLFAPAQVDWLTTSRVVPQSPTAPVIDDVQPIVAHVPAPLLPTAQISNPEPVVARAPMPTVTPMMRPDRAAPAEILRAPATTARSATPALTPRLSTQGTAQFEPAPPIARTAPPQSIDAIENVWVLGVYR